MSPRRWLLALMLASALCMAETPPAEPLFQALQKSDATAVKQLLERGTDANARDADGTPALMAAVLYSSADCVRLLLDRGADPNGTNKAGASALMWAVPDLTKTRLLIDAGAYVNAHSAHAATRRSQLSRIGSGFAIAARSRRRYPRQGPYWYARAGPRDSFR